MSATDKTTNYFDTFIEVAEDCPVDMAETPVPKNGVHTVASMQFEMLAKQPYKFTSDDVMFTVFAKRSEIKETKEARAAFFAKGQPCMRASPLTKRYGWGVHSDKHGRIAIYAFESPEYRKLAKDVKLKHLKAMRSARASK